jgi:hypothetical protein
MANYILFEKKSENDRPPWTMDLVKTFCEEAEIDYKGIVEENLFFVAKVADHDEEQKFRLVELTPTITFLVIDEPTLDEFLEPEVSVKKIESLKVIDEGDEKGQG